MFFYLCHLCIFPKSSQPLYPFCFAFFCSFTWFSDNSLYCYLWSTLLGGLESGQGLLLPSMEDSSGEKIRLFFLPFSPCLPHSLGVGGLYFSQVWNIMVILGNITKCKSLSTLLFSEIIYLISTSGFPILILSFPHYSERQGVFM